MKFCTTIAYVEDILFVSGQAAKAWYNVDWAPTLNLGHDKKIDKTNLKQASQRGQRASEKDRKRKEQQEWDRWS